MTTGSPTASSRKQRGSVRSGRPSLPHCGSRPWRSICLMECTLNPRSISVSTAGPCGTSIATWISSPQPRRSSPSARSPFRRTLRRHACRPFRRFFGHHRREEHMMALRRPVDAGITIVFDQLCLLPVRAYRDLRRSLYWRSEKAQVRRELPAGHRSRPIRRGTRPPRWSKHGGDGSLPTNRLGSGRLRQFGPSPMLRATFGYASRRDTYGELTKNRMRTVREPGHTAA